MTQQHNETLRFAWGALGVEMLELTGRNLALGYKLVDLTLLKPDHAPESVCGQVPLVDQAVQRSRNQSEGRCGFFRGQPIAICLRHTHHHNALSDSLSHSRTYSRIHGGFQ